MALKCLLNYRTPLELWPGVALHLLRITDDDGPITVDIALRTPEDEEAHSVRLRSGEVFEVAGRQLKVASISRGGLYPVELHQVRDEPAKAQG